MAKTFSLRGMLVPSQGRKTSSQGGGMPGGGAVAIGTPRESASTVINNINNVTNVVGGDYSKIVRITISDLLALDPTEVGENDLYIVYASGSDEDGWSGDPFEYDGETYPAESFFQLINGEWQPITDEIDLSKSPKFGNLPEEVYMVEGLFPPTSFPNIYGRDVKAGMRIAKVRRYRLDDAGVYQPVKESTGTPGGGTSVNDMLTINIPFARRYLQGGEYHYEGGVLTAADYQRLMEGQQVDGGVFVATYGVTTFQELEQAYEDGKMIIVRQDPIVAVLGYFYVNEFHFFAVDKYTSSNNATIYEFRMSFANGWRGSSFTTENKGDRVSSSELSERLLTDNKYLSALSVKTLIEEYIADLASVASSGDYNDLINKPTIPSSVTDAVKYTAQSLTDAQKAQARQNIGAGETLTFDATPTANSANPVTSEGIRASLSGKMDTDASNATNAAVQNLLDTLPYTSRALTGDDSLVMKIDDANAYKEIPITSLSDYIAAPVLASPGSGSISDWDGRLVYQSAGANRRISAVLSPIAVNTTKHSVAVGTATASGDYSFASGYYSTASGDYSLSLGQNNTANNVNATCLGGYGNTASGQSAVCIGGSSSTASAMYAVASGSYALADHDHMMAIGKYSRGWTASCTAHGISAAGSDYLLFTVGSGAGPNSRKNSFEVWSTDEAYIGDRGVATLYTITVAGTDSDSYPSTAVCGKGLEKMGHSWNVNWKLYFEAINLLTTDKNTVADWYASHAFSVFYHDLDDDTIYTSPSDIGLTLGFYHSQAVWYPQVNFTDQSYFKNRNYKCVIQFIGK